MIVYVELGFRKRVGFVEFGDFKESLWYYFTFNIVDSHIWGESAALCENRSCHNKAIFAPNKSEVIGIWTLHYNTSILTCDSSIGHIKGVSTLKILCVTFDETLTFIQHATILVSKIKKTLFALKHAARIWAFWRCQKFIFCNLWICKSIVEGDDNIVCSSRDTNIWMGDV